MRDEGGSMGWNQQQSHPVESEPVYPPPATENADGKSYETGPNYGYETPAASSSMGGRMRKLMKRRPVGS